MRRALLFMCIVVVLSFGAVPSAQVAKGLVDPNVAPDKELLTLPHLSPAIVKALLERRPFANAIECV